MSEKMLSIQQHNKNIHTAFYSKGVFIIIFLTIEIVSFAQFDMGSPMAWRIIPPLNKKFPRI